MPSTLEIEITSTGYKLRKICSCGELISVTEADIPAKLVFKNIIPQDCQHEVVDSHGGQVAG